MPGFLEEFRVFYGPWNRLRSTISGRRGVWVGRNTTARQERRDTVLAVLEAGDQEAERLVRDGSVDAVPGDVLKGGFAGSAEGWLYALKVGKPAYAM